ncbi:hypothetical protein P153DRAFT_362524 [Dothidotthia symphoricarpi CBS 119687]|uniref:Uncharacterized protein n=1 Tax=Dothidotthia symphoricarpi CBS 119687 TaxID=1392245 RepID=A0A6A6AW79_9PLEO|nr:uncharacterized protein P153DRAFT_362524 [Dothidotthia symphoricarpi CBS 119687]KAF2134791.1 hypothetical protein P153DRAFT_362524 [Dothidotthia symphoricarpi CBS 119687]
MAGKNNHRIRDAKKRRRTLANKSRLHITAHPHGLRTLKPSARKQLERDRAPGLWIYPWYLDPTRQPQARQYPHASLLGLPAELRQRVLYESFDVQDLRVDGRRWTEADRRDVTWAGTTKTMKLRRMDQGIPKHLELTRSEGGLVVVLGRRIAQMCRVAPLVRSDMLYVGKMWERDLKSYVERELCDVQMHGLSLPVVAAGSQWLVDVETEQRTRKKGTCVEIYAGRKHRPPKCWYCTERHRGGDSVCPMARRDPERWGEMTKKVGGKRGGVRLCRVFKGRKIVFRDEEA